MTSILDLASEMLGAENNEEDVESNEPYNSENEDSEEELDKEDNESYYSADSGTESGSEDEGDSGDSDESPRDHADNEETRTTYLQSLGAGNAMFRLPQGIRLKLSEALLQLSMMFWTYQSQDGAMTSSTIIHFAGVLGIQPSSLAYRNAYDYTPDLAALVWVGRLLFLEYSLPRFSYDTLVYRWPCRTTYPSHRSVWKRFVPNTCSGDVTRPITYAVRTIVQFIGE